MLLTITTTHQPATDLGYLLHKNPSKVQHFELAFGTAHIFYPDATDERCTAALLLDIDPIGLVRNRHNAGSFDLGQYVNDRPYVASSFMSVAISRVFGTAMNGTSKERPELAETPIPLTVTISVIACRGGEDLLKRLFEPLGYTLTVTGHPLDEHFPAWGDSPYFDVTLENTCRLADLLSHLYVLIPVLDDEKHYWIGEDEVEKLLQHGEGWLANHPERKTITRRYLKHQGGLMRAAMARLIETDQPDPDSVEITHSEEEAVIEKPISLNDQRVGAVIAAIKASGARRVLDLGCAEGQLIRALMKDPTLTEIVGLDVSHRMLEIAADRIGLADFSPRQKERIKLIQGSLTYRDKRLEGYEAAAVVEVIEHLDPPRLAAFERIVFEFARPATIVLTTPNREYNVKFETLPGGSFRHRDHRFEWTRAEFAAWASQVADRFDYTVRFLGIGENDPVVGVPTQMAIFTLGPSLNPALAVQEKMA